MFGYLKSYSKGWIVIDPNYQDWDKYSFKEFNNWKEFYPDTEEDEKPPNMPEPLGKTACIMVYIDADHVHNQLMHKLVTRIILFINNTPVSGSQKDRRPSRPLPMDPSWLLPELQPSL